MTVKKVNIDELMQLLFEMKKEAEHVDMSIEPGNILKVRKHVDDKDKEGTQDFLFIIA